MNFWFPWLDRITIAAIVGALVSSTLAQSDELPIIEASATDELRAKEGQKVIVFGETTGSGKSPSGTNFVNFQDADFYLIAFKSDLDPFKEGEPADILNEKRIAVTGVVTIYQDKPQIKLVGPDQVRVLKEDEIFPPKKQEETAGAEEESQPEVVATEEPEPVEPEEAKEKPPVDWRKFFK